MGKRVRAYFGLGWILSIIFAILPTNVIFGIITRAFRGKILGLILNIIFAPVFYVIDLISIIIFRDLKILA